MTLPSNLGEKSSLFFQEVTDDSVFPNFSRPKILGCFSLNEKTDYVDSPAGLRFLRLPDGRNDTKIRVNIDLNENCPAQIREDEERNHINTSELKHLLNWIHAHRNTFEEKRPDFVMYRGLMTSLLGTPYENRDTWCVGAIRKNGTIYLRQLDTEESLKNRKEFNGNPRLRRFGAWGHHFENYLMAEEPNCQPNPEKPSKTECNVMYFARLNQHSLLYCGELDGVWQKDERNINPKETPERLSECNLVELKTTRFFPRGQMTHNFKRINLRKWWCQSFPACISDVVVGYRDDEGSIRELEVFPLRVLPKLGVGWSGTVCFNFLDQFLTEVKKVVRNDPNTVYVFTFDPKKQLDKGHRIMVCAEKNSPLYLANLV